MFSTLFCIISDTCSPLASPSEENPEAVRSVTSSSSA